MAYQFPCDLGNHIFCVGWDACDCQCHEDEAETLGPVLTDVTEVEKKLAADWDAVELRSFIEAKDQDVRALAALWQIPNPQEGQLKQRPGDQPLPIVNDEPDIQSQVIADIEERRQVGIQRYGTALQPNNGRDALRDAYEEAMDLAIYLKQCIVERDAEKGVRPAGMKLS